MKRKEVEKSVDRHIRITDIGTLEQIDEIMKDSAYKSFSKVINDALFYGLPILHNNLYGEVTIEEQPAPPRPQVNGSRLDDKLFDTIVRLLKETGAKRYDNKSILLSLIHDLKQVSNVLLIERELC